VSQVADATFGSSDATQFPNTRRVGVTAAGRTLVTHGKHKDGVQLAWSADGQSWSRATRGDVTDGRLLPGQKTGDRPASLVITTVDGVEHAWVFMAAASSGSTTPLWARRLSELDHPDGPLVGPLQVLSQGIGASKPDAAVEIGPDGTPRIAVLWLHRAETGRYQLTVQWVENLATDRVALDPTSRFVFSDTATGARQGTLIESPTGLGFVGRADPVETSSALVFWRRDHAAPAHLWTRGADGPTVESSSYPAGVWADGQWMVAAQRATTNTNLRLVHWSADGTTASTRPSPVGYLQPAMAAAPDGRAAIVTRRASDQHVISWHYRPGTGWDHTDRNEFSTGGPHLWPNTDRTIRNHQLRFIVTAPGTTTDRTSIQHITTNLSARGG
jgi:hypothetical protein